MDQKTLVTRKSAVLLTAVALLASLVMTVAPASPGPASGKSASSLSPALFDKGLEGSGRVVRRDGGVEVTRVTVTHNGQERVLYRVKVKGDFPPRALRYVVTADGVRVGYGLPTPSQGAVQTVTGDAGVLDASIEAGYEGSSATSSDRDDVSVQGSRQDGRPIIARSPRGRNGHIRPRRSGVPADRFRAQGRDWSERSTTRPTSQTVRIRWSCSSMATTEPATSRTGTGIGSSGHVGRAGPRRLTTRATPTSAIRLPATATSLPP